MTLNQADFDVILTQVVGLVQSVKAMVITEDSDVVAIKTAVDALLAKALGSGIDLTNEGQALQSALADLTASSQELTQQHSDLQATITKANA